MKVKVITLTGETYEVDCADSCPVQALKAKIEAETGIPATRQRLYLDGRLISAGSVQNVQLTESSVLAVHGSSEDNKDAPVLTTQQGAPIADNHNSLKAGARGPTLLEDHIMREKIFHFDHERIPERVVHARGFGARGYFETYEPLADVTCADLFQRQGEKTEVFVRFSTVVGNKGSMDLARDVRGFAVKFYTKEGNWDLVGNNIPVFFIQDAIKFPDLVHAAKPEPHTGVPQAQSAHDNFWDFVSLMPESMHMQMWIMSDRSIPRSFRFMEGFGVHTFRFINAEGKSTFVKFHWKPVLGMQSVVWNEALKINGADPDYHRRDLWTAIQNGQYPEWELCVQLFDEAFANSFVFDVLDATKLVPEELVPTKAIGRLVLDQCVDNFFAETEQVAFCTNNVVPGIDFTNDPLLQGRNFSYLDTQLKRLGSTNFTQLPVNAPRCPVRLFQQDGHMTFANVKGRANYEPNSWGTEGGPRECPMKGFRSFAAPVSGDKLRVRSESFSDHYSQARQFYVSQTETEQRHIAAAFTFELSKVKTLKIRERVVSHLLNVDKTLAERVAQGLGLQSIPKPAAALQPTRWDIAPSDKLSILKNPPPAFVGRVVGVLVCDGFDQALFDALKDAVEHEGSRVVVIAPRVGGATSSSGKLLEADEKLDGAPSVLFDAVALIFGNKGADAIVDFPPANDFVTDAFAHCKFIAYNADAEPELTAAGVYGKRDDGFVKLAGAQDATAFVKQCRQLRYWKREEHAWGH